MTGHRHDDLRDELAPFARDAAAELDARAAAVRPDFATMMARARQLAEEVEASPRAPVIPLVAAHDDEPDEHRDEASLAPFTAALRGELDAKLFERGLAGIPPLPAAAPRKRPVRAVVGALMAAAAVALLFAGTQAVRQFGRADAVEANAVGESDPQRGVARSEPPRERAGAVPPASRAPAIEPVLEDRSMEEPPEEPPAASTTSAKDSLDAAPALPRPRRAEPRKPTATNSPSLSLEEEAQALWQRGELAAAEQKLREVLRQGGPRAELAYADLFALTRQMRGVDGQAGVWREYLARFPGGRFAEDARAGLCQRASGDARTACWQDYREHHPDGTHRSQAEAAGGGP